MAEREFLLYDTMSRQLKPLRTLEPGHLRFYSCGPTVYSYAHIGNFRTFLTGDLVCRVARALGWRVSYVTNITDVGHLTQDDVADASGDDKMEKALQSKEGEAFANVWELADHYANAFKDDWRKLNLQEPMLWPKATQHMREQILAIEKLIEKGHAYVTPSAVYFRISSFPDHGKLSGNIDKDQLQVAVRNVVVDESKENPSDFALWKRDDKHLMQWFSPWGWGFPGWHIECSVMAMAYLGETLDLHAGGEDLVFPHHESEIAQSECLTGKTFSNHWIHTRFLQVDGEKMSKSLGNWYTVRDLVVDKEINPLALRYALISVPYGKPLNFTMQTLKDATSTVERYAECQRLVALSKSKGSSQGDADNFKQELDRLYDETLEALCNDLNTSVALAKAYEGTKVILRESDSLSLQQGEAAGQWLERINDLLGIVHSDYGSLEASDFSVAPQESAATELMAARTEAKKAKDFARADAIRGQIEALGFEVRDTPEGPILKKLGSAL